MQAAQPHRKRNKLFDDAAGVDRPGGPRDARGNLLEEEDFSWRDERMATLEVMVAGGWWPASLLASRHAMPAGDKLFDDGAWARGAAGCAREYLVLSAVRAAPEAANAAEWVPRERLRVLAPPAGRGAAPAPPDVAPDHAALSAALERCPWSPTVVVVCPHAKISQSMLMPPAQSTPSSELSRSSDGWTGESAAA